ncbi:dipeptidase [Streptomyces johnsoniae]|uniref:Membrane dipeptidase n=1 Tax=Streptomyces johnsoniae TaxID=3075532 RepID=A0ABU2RXZ0_9ACTN|nr:membrane dipeptidase [Streptomyces sp. DSM 41886]MDT0441626.1 membrane dipeptidase [Streptomyces sp. DSM 41886]
MHTVSNETSTPRRPPTRPPLLWEQHCCLPLERRADVGELARYRRPGGSFVSVNVGYAPHSADDVVGLIAGWRERIAADDRLRPAVGIGDVEAAARADDVAVAFDLEDSGPLGGQLDRVRQFYELGVRTMLPSYNNRNAAGGGCLDAVDEGLTAYGRELVREMNAVGMVVDGSHCGARTGLDMCEVSEQPVIYSHSCMRALWDHPRNITDEQARECAATGGVVGITGVGIFLGPNDASVEALVCHIDHAVDLVGPEHVGLSTDYPFDHEDFNALLAQSPELFPDCYTRWGTIDFMPPEDLLTVGDALLARGYPEDAVTAILGGNFRRVATAVWR